MTCTDFLSKLTDYFDGQISPELLEEVRAALRLMQPLRGGAGHDAGRRSKSIATTSCMSSLSEFQERLHTAIMDQVQGTRLRS